ncbi:MAG: hypothetical protein P8M05_05985 [Flavobacteriales bacterium]|nr:hypothetical protein [Flavobacteriales bacterium]
MSKTLGMIYDIMFQLTTFDSNRISMKITIVLLAAIITLESFAQEAWTLYRPTDSTMEVSADTIKFDTIYTLDFSKSGVVNVFKDTRIDTITALKKGNRNLSKPGYRVQILLSHKKNEVNTKRAEFLRHYDDCSAHIIWQQPNFSLKVGDFYTRQQAVEFKYEIVEHFPSAIVVKDNIILPKL